MWNTVFSSVKRRCVASYMSSAIAINTPDRLGIHRLHCY